MKRKFLSSMNDLIADAYLEMSDEDVDQFLIEEGSPFKSEISEIHSLLQMKVSESRARQLALIRERFNAQSHQDQDIAKVSSRQSIDSMLNDIVHAIQNKSESVPNGILLAFRNQTNENDDESIQQIWNDLVALGLIQTDEGDDQN